MVQKTTIATLAISVSALVIALIALSFTAFTERTDYGYIGSLDWRGEDISEEEQRLAEIERTKPQVDYTLYTTGNYPCVIAEGVSIPGYELAVGNPSGMDVVADFTVTARNAGVSWDNSTGFNQSSTKRITVFAGTEGHFVTFYIRPHLGTDNLSLSTDAKAVEPTNAPVRTSDQPIITYYKDDSGNYCH